MTIESMLVVAISVTMVIAIVLAVALVRSRRGGAADPLDRLGDLELSLAGRDGALDARVSQLDSRLAALQETVTGREAALDQHVRGIGLQMQAISSLFSNDRARGGWGEISMMRIFELGGLVEDRDYTSHFQASEGIPDAVVHLPGGRNVVIDSKFPVARYNEAMSADTPDDREALLAEQGKEIERLGKSLVDKGYAKLASGDYLVIYIASQPVYETAAAAHPELLEKLMRMRVIVAGPTTLFALLMNVGSLMTEHRALQQADQILGDARELHSRMTVFVGHLRSLSAAIAKTVAVFNSVVGSWSSRVGPALGRFSELTGEPAHDPIDPVDDGVRELETDEHAAVASAGLRAISGGVG